MAKGNSLHIGVNNLGPSYSSAGWKGSLKGCVKDAKAMYDIASAQGYVAPPSFGINANLLLDEDATISAVTIGIRSAKANLNKGDYFLLTFSGHGSYCPDKNGDEESDGQDETWCLWDAELLDDELYGLLAEFNPGVRILVVADCCYSAPNSGGPSFLPFAKVINALNAFGPSRQILEVLGLQARRERALPREVQKALQIQQDEYYAKVQASYPSGKNVDIGAAVLYLAACSEIETAEDGPDNGVFTAALRKVWNGGGFTGSHEEFFKKIVATISNGRHPQLIPRGAADGVFSSLRPFTIID